MLFPVVIVIVLFVAGNYAVGYLGDGLSGVIEVKMTEWIEGISWLEWVSGVAGFLVKLLTRFQRITLCPFSITVSSPCA